MLVLSRTLALAAVNQRVQEHERRGPRSQECLVLLFLRLSQSTFSPLPAADGFQGLLPPSRPLATTADNSGTTPFRVDVRASNDWNADPR